jgi:ferritin-like metal-binding protein YciE
MAINGPADLFLYELSGMHDAEEKSAAWKGEIADRIRDSTLQQLIRAEQQESQQRTKNLEECFHAVGARPRAVPCVAIEGMRAEYQQFLSQQPSPEALEMYSIGFLMKAAHFGVGSYRGLVDKALLMGEIRCAQILKGNLVLKEEDTGRLERISHAMNRQVMATA